MFAHPLHTHSAPYIYISNISSRCERNYIDNNEIGRCSHIYSGSLAHNSRITSVLRSCRSALRKPFSSSALQSHVSTHTHINISFIPTATYLVEHEEDQNPTHTHTPFRRPWSHNCDVQNINYILVLVVTLRRSTHHQPTPANAWMKNSTLTLCWAWLWFDWAKGS